MPQAHEWSFATPNIIPFLPSNSFSKNDSLSTKTFFSLLSNFLKTKDAFVPPNPKLLLNKVLKSQSFLVSNTIGNPSTSGSKFSTFADLEIKLLFIINIE